MTAKVLKGHCPNCGPGIFADVAAEFNDKWEDDDNGIWGNDDHRIMHCRGCTRVYYQTSSIFSEDDRSGGPTITHWPTTEKRKQPVWLWKAIRPDRQLRGLIEQSYIAFNHGASTLAAIGLRTVFDRSSELLGVDPSLSFAKKLDALLNKGNIGVDERAVLDALADAGSAAAHRGWEPSQSELNTMFDIVEGFIHRSFFVTHAAKALKSKVPAKPKPATKKP